MNDLQTSLDDSATSSNSLPEYEKFTDIPHEDLNSTLPYYDYIRENRPSMDFAKFCVFKPEALDHIPKQAFDLKQMDYDPAVVQYFKVPVEKAIEAAMNEIIALTVSDEFIHKSRENQIRIFELNMINFAGFLTQTEMKAIRNIGNRL